MEGEEIYAVDSFFAMPIFLLEIMLACFRIMETISCNIMSSCTEGWIMGKDFNLSVCPHFNITFTSRVSVQCLSYPILEVPRILTQRKNI